ncbi:DUF1211 domain-containing protein [Vagococcus sp. DIV0080]|uniref:DUF1211 domain-containing protein n=1 Tax=Candidatus Vagococcus giribetii TaxID=2230876 RepID=A0ABS3HQI3_9ENTE|nr:TMEM175 family protein [Vagococcus sp. DIV0080]MBO0476009.1 DUF1211 domain-containing protein [Vagococcus sp. DIV0080]
MTKNRLEAFSDGVMAIVITVLVLNLTIPQGDSFQDLVSISQKVVVYIFSFALVAVYWNNHHHLFHIIPKIDAKVIWTNHFFLLVLTLLPFTTAWISEHLFSLLPQFLYGLVILLADFVFLMLLKISERYSEANTKDIFKSLMKKTIFSVALNLVAIILGIFVAPILVSVVNLLMITLWVVPDKRIEDRLNSKD